MCVCSCQRCVLSRLNAVCAFRRYMSESCKMSCNLCDDDAETRAPTAPALGRRPAEQRQPAPSESKRPTPAPPSPEGVAEPLGRVLHEETHLELGDAAAEAAAAAAVAAAESPHASQHLLKSSNVSALLQHTRQTLQAALHEVKECRADRLECRDELSKCELSAESMGQSEVTRKLASLRARCDPKTLEAQCENACAGRIAKLEPTYRKKLEESARAVKLCKSKLDAQQQLEAQLGTLRKKLELKQQLETAIEGRHSKLTEVYKSLDAECQSELRACKAGQPGGAAKEGGAKEAVPCQIEAGGVTQYLHMLLVLAFGFICGFFAQGRVTKPGGGRKIDNFHHGWDHGWATNQMVAMEMMKIS